MSAALPKWNGTAAEVGQQLKTVSNLVVPLDGGAVSRAAIPVARGLAQLYAATPHLVYVGKSPMEPKSIHLLLGVPQEDLPGVVFHCCDTESPEAIVRIARELPGAVIVICTQLGETVQASGFGSFTETVLASSPERILLVPPERGETAWNLKRILLAHSGTPDCDPATGMAAELATLARTEVVAMHVATGKAGSPEAGSISAPQYIDQPQHEWPAWTGEFLDRMLAMGAPTSAVQFDLLVAGGQRGSEIAEKARERHADLVIMAWDREWQSEKHMATRTVILSCGCPVLLVASKPA
jgi:nucleotide-binding universal stress UspA family protein